MAEKAIILTAVALSLAALIWCFIGFTSALKEQPKLIGLLVRLQKHRQGAGQQAIVIESPGNPLPVRQISNVVTPGRRKAASVKLDRKG